MDGEQRTRPDQFLSTSQAKQVDDICSEFEQQLTAGQVPQIENRLAKVDSPLRLTLLRELIAIEVDHRQRNGKDPSCEQYRQRFPEFADHLTAAWTSLVGRSAADSPTQAKPGPLGPSPARQPSSDLNLLFGVLALQMGFVTRHALLSAMNAWVLRKETPLANILREADAIGGEECRLLEALVVKHLELHGGKPEESLAALSPIGPLRGEMEQVKDADLAQSLVHLAGVVRKGDPHATISGATEFSDVKGARFRILRPHAEGGLGLVSVAQDEELQREVALKEIRPVIAHDANLRNRFILEAEITGGLEHPGIVPVYGLGQYTDGRPFYAMRFIRGDSLKEAVERFHAADRAWDDSTRQLELRKLLGRFVDVCQAIEYAHSRGVLHRDLKPGNIMLGKYGETLVVDWGLAKAKGKEIDTTSADESLLRPNSGSHSDPTALGSAVGTPGYMSPEQAAGKLDVLGCSSDVYGLGATLYHVLTGRQPISGKDLGKVLRRVQQGDFPSPRECNSQVPQALSAICQRAMALEPDKRYESAAALADDVERWLADEPVTAHNERATERLSRWFRKHRTIALFSVLTLSTVTVVSGVAAIIIAGQNARIKSQERAARAMAVANQQLADQETLARSIAERREKEAELASKAAVEAQRKAEKLADEKAVLAEAERLEAQKAKRLTEFLVGSFEAADPLGIGGIPFYIPKNTGELLTVRDLLDRGHQRVEQELAAEPDVQATVKNTIGNVYRSLGYLGEAEQLLVSALAQRRKFLPASSMDLAQSCHDLAWLYHERGDFRRAEPLYREALSIRQQHEPDSELLTVATMQNLGWMFAQDERFEEAQQWFEKTIDARTRLLGSGHRDTAVAQLGMALCLFESGHWLQAVPYANKARAGLLSGDQDPNLSRAAVKFMQGLLADKTVGLAQAEQLILDAQNLLAESLGDEHPYIGFFAFERGRRLDELGRDADAEECYKKALKIARDKVQLQHPRVRILAESYGRFLVRHDRTDEAMAIWKEFLDAQESVFGEESVVFADALVGYAMTQKEIGDKEAAEKTLRRAVPIFGKAERLNRLAYLTGASELALMLVRKKVELDYAERLLRRVMTEVEKRYGSQTRDFTDSQVDLARALMEQGKHDEAETLLRSAETMGRTLVGRDRRESLDWIFWWRSKLYRRTKQHRDVVKSLMDMSDLWPDDADELYLAAAELSSCLSLVPEGTAETTSERERIAKLSFSMLQKAIDQGYRDVDEIRKDRRWDSLRDRPEFKDLLQHVAEPRS